MQNHAPDAPAAPADPGSGAPPEARPADSALPAPVLPDPEIGLPVEIGGPSGPEPTRYGDWERKGRCIDF